jgi:hypothetical protein
MGPGWWWIGRESSGPCPERVQGKLQQYSSIVAWASLAGYNDTSPSPGLNPSPGEEAFGISRPLHSRRLQG